MKWSRIVVTVLTGSLVWAMTATASPNEPQKKGTAKQVVGTSKPAKPLKAHPPKPEKVRHEAPDRFAKYVKQIDKARTMTNRKISSIRAREAREIAHEREKETRKDGFRTVQRIADIRARADRQIAHEQEKLDDKIAKIQEKQDRERVNLASSRWP